MTTTFRDAAAALARRGLAVLPIRPGRKEPATSHGALDATSDMVRISEWWAAMPDANIGIATGAASGGLLVLDVDDKGNGSGEASLRKLEAQHGELPQTVEVISGSGRHVYFRSGKALVNSAGLLGSGLDTRGTGGYVLAPPSIHPGGRVYAWSVDCGSRIAPAPDWLVDKLVAQQCAGRRKPLAHWHGLLTGPIASGTRNSALTSVAGKLLSAGLDVVTTHDLVQCVNEARCVEPLPAGEVESLVTSIAMREINKRVGAGHGT